MGRVRDQGRPGRDTKDVATSAGIWVRVSGSSQDEANQLPRLERHCYDQNYRVNKRYTLPDTTAYHGDHQPELDELLEDIRTGVIKVVVCRHSDRLDRRGPKYALPFLWAVTEAGGRVECLDEPQFGNDDDLGGMFTYMSIVKNHKESADKASRVRDSHNRIRVNRANGTGLLGRAPFGYDIEGSKYEKVLVPNKLGLEYVPEIFARIIDGESLATVAKWLNAEGVPTGTKFARDKNHRPIRDENGDPGKAPTWSASTVAQIIRNTAYKGQLRDSNHELAGPCEAIVSVQIWEAAGKRLDAAPKRGPQDNANRAMLASVLFCECGSPMYRVKTAAILPYYRCAGKVTEKSCLMIRLSVVDEAVNEIMSANPEPVMKMTLVEGKNYDQELDLVKAQIKALDLDDPDYDERYASLMAERSRLKDLDTTPDTWEPRPTGQTWGGLWDDLEPAERSRWLARQGFRVTATREAVTVMQGDVSAAVPIG